MMTTLNYIVCGLILSLLLFTDGIAQNSGMTSGGSLVTDSWKNIKQADRLFREKAYQEAAQIYEQIAKKKPQPELKLRLGKCYYFLNHPKKSVQWYQDVIDTAKLPDPVHRLYYAQALSRLKQYEKAKIHFEKYSQRANSYIANINLDTAFHYRHQGNYILKKFDNLNSDESDFAPVWYGNKVIFVSSRDDFMPIKYINRATGHHIFKLYAAEIINDKNSLGEVEIDKVEKFGKTLRSTFNLGPLIFYDQGNKMIFTQNNMEGNKNKRGKKGILHLGLYFAEKNENGNWSNIQPFEHNSVEYSLAHPAISKDGKTLYFVSDMPNGKGASDIYVSYRQQDNTWTPPKNLGSPINTAGKEIFPYLFKDKLYFSSDGHAGLGGLEIMRSRILDDGWTPPDNLGFPINTNADDFAFSTDETGRKALFTSNRIGGKGDDDIYAVDILQENESLRFLEVAGIITEENLLDEMESQPLKDVSIQFINTYENKSSGSVLTDSLGQFKLQLALETPYLIRATKQGFQPREYKIKPHQEKAISADEPYRMRLNSIFIALSMQNKNPLLEVESTPTEEASIISPSEAYVGIDTIGVLSTTAPDFIGQVNIEGKTPILYGIPVEVYDNSGNLLRTVRTDEEGKFRLDLEEKNSYVLKAQWENNGQKYTTDCLKLDVQKLPKNKITNITNLSLMPLSLNTKRIFRINYGVQEWEVTPEVEQELEKVVTFMKANPSVRAEISAHTDSRGKADYNQMLSLVRAQDAVKYLMMQGIDGNRLEARGYGEKIVLNHCTEGVLCSDEAHRQNRRIEVTVIGIENVENAEFDPVNCDYCPKIIIN